MKCVVCKTGDIVHSVTSVTLERRETTVVIKAVPADVCSTCGEEYIDESTAATVMLLAETAALTGAPVEVR